MKKLNRKKSAVADMPPVVRTDDAVAARNAHGNGLAVVLYVLCGLLCAAVLLCLYRAVSGSLDIMSQDGFFAVANAVEPDTRSTEEILAEMGIDLNAIQSEPGASAPGDSSVEGPSAPDLDAEPELPGWASTKDGCAYVYDIKRGDTLSKISGEVLYSVDALAAYNHIRNVNLIYAGSTLRVPDGTSCTCEICANS